MCFVEKNPDKALPDLKWTENLKSDCVQTELLRRAEQTLISSRKQKQPYRVAVMNMSKQRGTCTVPLPPHPSLQKHTEEVDTEMHSTCRGWNDVYFLLKVKDMQTETKGKQKNERLHVTCSSLERKVEARHDKIQRLHHTRQLVITVTDS